MFRRGLKNWLPRHKCHGLAYFTAPSTEDNHHNMTQTTAINKLLMIGRVIGMESALMFSGDANSGPAGKKPPTVPCRKKRPASAGRFVN